MAQYMKGLLKIICKMGLADIFQLRVKYMMVSGKMIKCMARVSLPNREMNILGLLCKIKWRAMEF